VARPENKRPAERGDYGTPVTTREGEIANALLASIKRELADADYFTREDLIHLGAFNFVATITRYNYIRIGIRILIDRGQMIEKSRTELVMVGKAKKWQPIAKQVSTQEENILQLTRQILDSGEKVTVMGVVDAWKDQNLTQNVKRSIVRNAFLQFVRDGIIEHVSMGVYSYGRASKT
jgi:hypothetical protein